MNMIFRAVAALIPLLLAACLSQTSAPSSAPTLISVTPGEGRGVLNWTDLTPGLTYWVYYKNDTDDPTGAVVSKNNFTGIAYNLTSPAFVGGLINGKEYSFLVTSSNNTSSTGPVSAMMKQTPRLVDSGTDWTVTPNFTSKNMRGIAYGNNYYAMVGDSSTIFTATHNYSIPGGVTTTDSTGKIPYGWIQSPPPTGSTITNYSAVIYNGSGFFVALGEDGTTIYSSVTTTWTLGTLATPTPVPVVWTAGTSISAAGNTMNALALGGVYVAVGNGGKIFTTPGITSAWTERTSPSVTTENLYGVSYLNGIYIAVGAHGTLLTSPDGTTWTSRTTNTTQDLYQVAYGLYKATDTDPGVTRYVAVGDKGTIISSVDYLNWSLLTPAITAENLRTICFGPAASFINAGTSVPYSQFIAAGTMGTVLISATGDSTNSSSWTASTTVPTLIGANVLNSIVPTDALIAVGTAGTIVSVQ